MKRSDLLQTTARGYRTVSPAERAGFEMLSAFSSTVAASRALNYVRERRRPAPRLRSLTRRAHTAAERRRLRVHHYVPGIGLIFAAGGAAILTRPGDREAWLSLTFGAGAGLTLDEIALLIQVDNPYWRSETAALAQAAVAALAAGALAARFHRRGAAGAAE